MNNLKYILLLALTGFYISCGEKSADPEPEPEPEVTGPVAAEKTNTTKLWVHYMPWFETPSTSDNGKWGQHWTMANRNPENVDENGKREIASHYYPLIGPYASSDKDVIEYHLLLMKYTGIDGVIIDWYGSYDLWDYPLNRRNAEALIDMLDDVGLDFAITYEDNTLGNLISNGIISNAVEGAIADFEYMSDNYFNLDSYIQIDNEPLLTVFGPQFITTGEDWTTVLNNIPEDPVFLSLWFESGELGANASGEYSWVYEDNSHIKNFYDNQAGKFSVAMGSAYPGFNDFYAQGGWGENMSWSIEHNNGETLETTLAMATSAGADYVQLVTWNDFGEGTMIEPTLEFEYDFLEHVQNFAGVEYSKSELESIYTQFTLRKEFIGESDKQEILDQAFEYWISLETEKAKSLVDSLSLTIN